MTPLSPLLRDVIALVHAQLGTEETSGLVLLASDDPVMFIVDVITFAKNRRLDVPDPMIGALKSELIRSRTAQLEAAEDLGHRIEATDSIASRQRQVDAVAARVRDGGRRRGSGGPQSR